MSQRYLVLSLVEIGPVVLEKNMNMWKAYDNANDDDNNDNDDGQRTNFKHLSAKNVSSIVEGNYIQ